MDLRVTVDSAPQREKCHFFINRRVIFTSNYTLLDIRIMKGNN